MVIDFSLSLSEYSDQPGIYNVMAVAYNEVGDRIEVKTWEGISAHKASGMFSAFRVRVIRQYNPNIDAPPADEQLELPF